MIFVSRSSLKLRTMTQHTRDIVLLPSRDYVKIPRGVIDVTGAETWIEKEAQAVSEILLV